MLKNTKVFKPTKKSLHDTEEANFFLTRQYGLSYKNISRISTSLLPVGLEYIKHIISMLRNLILIILSRSLNHGVIESIRLGFTNNWKYSGTHAAAKPIDKLNLLRLNKAKFEKYSCF